MNININTESIEIILEIAKLKKKLLKTIVPERTMEHLEVIGNEFKHMVLESIGDHGAKKTIINKKTTTGVKKVDIE